MGVRQTAGAAPLVGREGQGRGVIRPKRPNGQRYAVSDGRAWRAFSCMTDVVLCARTVIVPNLPS